MTLRLRNIALTATAAAGAGSPRRHRAWRAASAVTATAMAAALTLAAAGPAAPRGPARGTGPSVPDTTAVGGLRITGTLTFSMFIPAAGYIFFGGGSGGETQTGTFTIDLTSVHLPFDDAWTSNDSSYTFKDKVDAHEAAQPYGCPGGDFYTANGTGGGHFPEHPDPRSQTFIDAQWWYHRFDARPTAPLIYVGGQVAAHEEVEIKDSCGVNTKYRRDYEVGPVCPKLPFPKFGGSYGGYGTGGPFDGKNDTINLDCKGGVKGGLTYEIHGTLHVDAYMFVLPRDALTPAQWEPALTKPHHDYPAADIPVPDGTPYYAVTAGQIRYTKPNNETCGPNGITLIGMDGVNYTYCHGSRRLVENGQKVPPGTELGLTGHTGSAKGPHLHFELRIHNVQHCPQGLLWELYDGQQPPPDAKFVDELPQKGCSYVDIIVNKKSVRIEDNEATGLGIKEAAIAQGVKIQPDFRLTEIVANGKPVHLVIGDAEKIHLKTKDEFIAAAK